MNDRQWIALKNGHKILIRPITKDDIHERHEFYVNLSLAQTGMVHTADETEFHTHETEEHIKDFLKNKRGLWLIALNEKQKIVGEIDVTVENLARIRHNGKLTIGIVPAFQRQGLGALLMEHAIRWCEAHHISRLELSVFQSNHAALELYGKFGFTIIGIRKNYLRHADGSWEDDVVMEKHLSWPNATA